MPQKLSLEKFIEKAKSVHGDKYDYSLVEYKNSHSKIKLICPIHGEFEIVARDHIYSKCGCKKCSGNGKSNTNEFIKKARKIYGEKYDYSNVDYKNNKEKVCIICHNVDEQGNEHGVFFKGQMTIFLDMDVQNVEIVTLQQQKNGWQKQKLFMVIGMIILKQYIEVLYLD